MAEKKSAYAKAGVDIVKADQFVSSIASMMQGTHSENVLKGLGGYASLYRINDREFIAATTDGVGTKLKLAFELGKHDTVGIDLVAMSVNDLICVGARPLFFLDYFATGNLDLKVSKAVIKGIVEGCRQGKLALTGGETAEMPGIYKDGEYDLAGFAVGLVSKDELIDGTSIRRGDVLLGLESTGPHSNGYSLIRKLIEGDKTLARAVFAPTRIYVEAISALRGAIGSQVKGLAHITGSGFLNIPRINEGYDYDIEIPGSFNTPKIFETLKLRGKLSWEEMYTTFNMGIGMVAAVEPAVASRARQSLERAGHKAHVIGRVGAKSSKPCVRISGDGYSLELKY